MKRGAFCVCRRMLCCLMRSLVCERFDLTEEKPAKEKGGKP